MQAVLHTPLTAGLTSCGRSMLQAQNKPASVQSAPNVQDVKPCGARRSIAHSVEKEVDERCFVLALSDSLCITGEGQSDVQKCSSLYAPKYHEGIKTTVSVGPAAIKAACFFHRSHKMVTF